MTTRPSDHHHKSHNFKTYRVCNISYVVCHMVVIIWISLAMSYIACQVVFHDLPRILIQDTFKTEIWKSEFWCSWSSFERDNLIFSRIKKCWEFDTGIDPLTALFPKTFQLFKIVVSIPAFRYGNFDGGESLLGGRSIWSGTDD